MKIMIVEDDRTIHFGLKEILSAKGHSIVSSFSVSEALRLVDDSFDFYLLDIGLPDGTGFDILNVIRKGSDVPVIFLSAYDEEASIVKGFDLGADDYITKPFHQSELIRRITSLQRRSNIIKFKDLSVDVKLAKVSVFGTEVKLSVTEYQLLLKLLMHKDDVVLKEDIIESIWGEASSNTLSVTIKRLREKIGDGVLITNIQNEGYRIE